MLSFIAVQPWEPPAGFPTCGRFHLHHRRRHRKHSQPEGRELKAPGWAGEGRWKHPEQPASGGLLLLRPGLL